MAADNIPPVPANSYRVVLKQTSGGGRLDSVLMEALRAQTDSLDLKNVTRTQFKKLFNDKRIQIKGQPAKPSSSLASGTTYVDILGY